MSEEEKPEKREKSCEAVRTDALLESEKKKSKPVEQRRLETGSMQLAQAKLQHVQAQHFAKGPTNAAWKARKEQSTVANQSSQASSNPSPLARLRKTKAKASKPGANQSRLTDFFARV